MNFIRLTKRDDLPKSKEIMITVPWCLPASYWPYSA